MPSGTREKAGEKPKRKATGRPYEPGHGNPGPGRGHKKPADAGGDDLLGDMRRAYATKEDPDEPLGVKAAREFMKKDYPRFLMLYDRLARGGKGVESLQQEVSQTAAAPIEPPCEASLRVQDKIVLLMREMGVSEERIAAMVARSEGKQVANATRGEQ